MVFTIECSNHSNIIFLLINWLSLNLQVVRLIIGFKFKNSNIVRLIILKIIKKKKNKNNNSYYKDNIAQ